MILTEKTHGNAPLLSLAYAIDEFLDKQGVGDIPVVLGRPNSFSLGDITTNVAFAAGKRLKRAPLEVAKEIAAYLTSEKVQYLKSASAAAPGFVNITWDDAFYIYVTAQVLADTEQYGRSNTLWGQTWVVEHTSPNPNKAMHLGHLRNNLVGMSLGQLLEASGARVIYDAIDNDRGIAIAKLMWGFLARMKKNESAPTDVTYWTEHKNEWYTPEEKKMLPDLFVSECYVAGDADTKDPTIDRSVRDMVIAWEAHDPPTWELWKHVLSYAYAGMHRTLSRLGNRWDHVWHEHEHYEKGKEYVMKGLEKGVFKKLDDGAVLTQLSAYDIPDTILLKRDGTSLYITQDLALTAMKLDKYRADHLVWVVGPDQSLAFRQLFAVCEQLGMGRIADYTHVAYGYVGLKDEDGGFKKMSSRAGTVVLIDDVIDAVKEKLRSDTPQTTSTEPSEAEMKLEKLALAAVKFSILKSDRTQDLQFDVERSIETKGDSGIYVLYTYARALSILRKAKEKRVVPSEEEVVVNDATRLLIFYPDVVFRAASDLSVHHVAQYLLELASAFNAWYAQETILDGSGEEGKRLALVAAVASVIKKGLTLMHIDIVEQL